MGVTAVTGGKTSNCSVTLLVVVSGRCVRSCLRRPS